MSTAETSEARMLPMQTTHDSEPSTMEELIEQLGEAGVRLTELNACEGAAGNLSIYCHPEIAVPAGFSRTERIELPEVVSELSGGRFIVTGSGARLRDICRRPLACLAIVEILAGGRTATLHYGRERQFARVTSEFNSHLTVHRFHIAKDALRSHAVVHAQPRRVTYLSHLDEYGEPGTLNRRLLRWQPEAILNFPEGIAVLPFLIPGQAELMHASDQALRQCRIAVWSKHGVMARSEQSILSAVDLVEYLEAAAYYECFDRLLGGSAQGLSAEQLRRVAEAYDVHQDLF
ncbi:MAG TPA: class II aldolase/adducin family protein [Polyangiaceae bacterium]